MRALSVVVATALAMVALTGAAQAAEIRVISSNALTEVLAVLGPQFEKATGNTLVVHYDTTTALRKDIIAGEAFDVAILTGPAMDDLVHASKVDPATRAEVARSGVGVAYKTGAPAPDIHDAASFKNAMLAAHTVAYTTAGASGLYFLSVCEKLGIADQVKAKSRVLTGGRVAELVARGEAELAAQQISELLPVAGVSIVPFPPDLQMYSSFPAAVASTSKQPQAAAALIRFLTDPNNAALLKSKGMEPG